MKGLIFKDLLAVRTVWVTFIIVMCLPLAAMMFLGSSVIAAVLIGLTMWAFCITNMMTALSLGSYDEQCGWDTFGSTLPVSRDRVVLARYGVDLLIMLASVLALAIMQLACLIRYRLTMGWYLLAVLVIFCLLTEAVSNPLVYRFGAQKCGYIFAGFICLTGLGTTFGIQYMTESADDLFDLLNRIFGSRITPIIVLLAVIVSAGLYALSLLLSIAIYKKKEF